MNRGKRMEKTQPETTLLEGKLEEIEKRQISMTEETNKFLRFRFFYCYY